MPQFRSAAFGRCKIPRNHEQASGVVDCGRGVRLPLLRTSSVARQQPAPASRPNIILMFPDNLGWGEVNVYGGVRGPITPRLDRLAAEGLRLNNFNVEFSCTVSRAGVLTGRYAIRTGATQGTGITLWEVTIAEALQSIGYATGLFGKWHLGGDHPENRNPSQQGFDEYYGIPRTSNEAQTTIALRWPSVMPSTSRAGRRP
jgi:arylsulfatase